MKNIPKCVRVRIWGFLCSVALLVLLCMLWISVIHSKNEKENNAVETSETLTMKTPAREEIIQGTELRDLVRKNVRVLIKTTFYESLFHKELTVDADQRWYLEFGENSEQKEWHEPGETILITEESVLFAQGLDCIRIGTEENHGKIFLKNVQRDQGIPAYRGTMEIRRLPDGMTVINCLGLEEYLLGVVPSEMPANYPKEALKAQAICARTYAVRHLAKPGYPELNANMDDSTSFQAYENQAESESASKAVKETEGMFLLSKNGSLADTFYYSTSCGKGTDDSVWDESEGGKADFAGDGLNDPDFLLEEFPEDLEFELPWYRWTYEVREIDVTAFESRLQILLGADERIEFHDLREMKVTERAKGGAAKELTILSDKGTHRIRGERKIRELLCDGKTMVKRKDGSEVPCAKLLPSAFFKMEIGKKNGIVVGYQLTGGGYGHGVGMSQNGAMEMALRGSTAEEILKYYYEDGVLSAMK